VAERLLELQARMTTLADTSYRTARGSKYSGQQLPTASRLYLDFQP